MRPSQIRNLIVLAVLVILALWASSTAADFIIEYNWWKEVGQVSTWVGMLWYSIAPAAAGSLVAFFALWVAHARGLHFAGIPATRFTVSTPALFPVGLAIVALFASASIDYWTVMRFFGSRGLAVPADAWKDQVFSRGLPFYLFDLPFYSEVLGVCVCAGDSLRPGLLGHGPGMAVGRTFLRWLMAGRAGLFSIGARALLLPGASRAGFVRIMAVILLLGFAAWVFLGNYELLLNSHAFMTGADYVDEKITLPLRWLLIVATLLAAVPLAWMSRYKNATILVFSVFILQLALPGIVRAVYVRPNEISIERPYIERHIQASTSAFGLDRNATERPFTASPQQTVDAVQDATLLDNVRLWDLRAYNATITQIQALRPYYTFPALPTWIAISSTAASSRCCCPARNRRHPVVRRGQPELDQSAVHLYARLWRGRVGGQQDYARRPARSCSSKTPRRKSNRPGFSSRGRRSTTAKSTQDPVFVHTAREEFDYPSGDQNKYSTYQGTGGFSGRLFSDENCRRDLPGRAQHYFHGLSHRAEPHDDLPQGAGEVGASGGLPALGPGPLPGDHRRRQAGLDGGRLYDFALASVFGDDSGGRPARKAPITFAMP